MPFPVEGFGNVAPAGAVHVEQHDHHLAEPEDVAAAVAAAVAAVVVPVLAGTAVEQEPVAADTEVVVVDNVAVAVGVDAADCTVAGVADIAVAGVVVDSDQDSPRVLHADQIPLLHQATASRLTQAVS